MPTSHLAKPVGRKVPVATAGRPPQMIAVNAFTLLVVRPWAIAAALISVAVCTETPTAELSLLT